MFVNKKAICHNIIPYYQNLEVFQEFELFSDFIPPYCIS